MYNKSLQIALKKANKAARKHVKRLKAYAKEKKLDLPIDIEKAIRNYYRKQMRNRYGASKYTPHQSGQECARRRNQINKGMIPLDQIITANH